MQSEYPRPIRLTIYVIVFALVVVATVVGIVLVDSRVHALAFLVALIVSVVLVTRLRSYRAFFRRWAALSPTAREREAGRRAELRASRIAGGVLIVMAVVMMVVQVIFGFFGEVVRGADLSKPGVVFAAYNRVAAPELAELTDLYIVRDLPLEQADSGDLRLLRNFYFAVEGYRFDSEDLQAVFGPLLWYQPRRAYPNDVNALPPAYRERVNRILEIERARGE